RSRCRGRAGRARTARAAAAARRRRRRWTARPRGRSPGTGGAAPAGRSAGRSPRTPAPRGSGARWAACTVTRNRRPRPYPPSTPSGEGPAAGPGPFLLAHADALGLLEDLALRLDRRRQDQLGELELADRPRPHRSHARLERADQVHGAVVGERRAVEDLLERPDHADADPGPPREVRVRGGHAPVV